MSIVGYLKSLHFPLFTALIMIEEILFQCGSLPHVDRNQGHGVVTEDVDLPLVLEEEEAVFLRQVVPGLDQLDQVALFGVGEFNFFVFRGHKALSVN